MISHRLTSDYNENLQTWSQFNDKSLGRQIH